MKITIEIDEDRIAELVENEIVRQVIEKGTPQNRLARNGVREGMEKAVFQYLYTVKSEIIERVIERASTEIVKKGLPKFISEIGRREMTP